MRKSRISNLTIDAAETKKIRKAMSSQESIKITININAETLCQLRSVAEKSGMPYQRLINRMLAESLQGSNSSELRLERLEKELNLLKKKISA